ncbi:MAG: cobaltochelatase subunit CobN, partial [Planctomycetes bacterium]|nr:cobaltochelatase subunit CobN [Planctomycetota bacterium]
DGARMREFEEVLATNQRTELLNRKWIEGMKEHGYAGAGHISELTKNTFGWDVTRSGSVTDATWADIYEIYVKDRYKLGMQEWFDKVNPHALQEMTATMLEAVRKGYWNADVETIATLSRVYSESVVKDGPSAGLVSGGNTKLDSFAAAALNAPGDAALAALAAKMLASVAASAGSSKDSTGKVIGQHMEVASGAAPGGESAGTGRMGRSTKAAMAALILGLCCVLVMYGFAARKGA